jgi:hypothetical protein
MDELDDRRHLVMIGAAIAHCTGCQQHQCWPQTLASALYDVFGHLTNEHNFGMQPA